MLSWLHPVEDEEFVRLTKKSWLKVLFVDLLWEKNTTEWLIYSADKSKQTGPK
jgi:hypothetical protein